MVKSALTAVLLASALLVPTLVPTNTHAQPAGACNEASATDEVLLKQYGETRRWSGVTDDNRTLFTLYFDKDSWTFVRTDETLAPDGITTFLQSCMLSSGGYSVTYSPMTVEEEEEF
jgi:hypothetical protein